MNPVIPPIAQLPRKSYPIRILQFGTGNFLRGFADWMFQIANDRLGLDLGVAVVQSVSRDETLARQQGTYTVVMRGLADGELRTDYQKVDVIQQIISASGLATELLRAAENPDLTFIISNTTELGITFEAEERTENQCARTYPGKLTQVLYQRFQKWADRPIAVLPCELIDNNGAALQQCVLEYARHWQLGPAFQRYVTETVTFCHTLVDRIVTGLPDNREAHGQHLGYADDMLTACEPYHLWVIEAPDWVQKQLPLPQAGLNVVYTSDVAFYRERKVKILNGAHSMMAPVGYLAGLTTVQQAMQHPVVGSYIEEAWTHEIIPTLTGDVSSLRSYRDDIRGRFLNPSIRHPLIHITLNSFSKLRVRLLPLVAPFLAQHDHCPERICFAFAAQLFLYRGLKGGKDIPLKDDPAVLAYMKERWAQASFTEQGLRELVAHVFAQRQWWGRDLNELHGFTDQVAHYLYLIDQLGIVESLQELEESVL